MFCCALAAERCRLVERTQEVDSPEVQNAQVKPAIAASAAAVPLSTPAKEFPNASAGLETSPYEQSKPRLRKLVREFATKTVNEGLDLLMWFEASGNGEAGKAARLQMDSMLRSVFLFDSGGEEPFLTMGLNSIKQFELVALKESLQATLPSAAPADEAARKYLRITRQDGSCVNMLFPSDTILLEVYTCLRIFHVSVAPAMRSDEAAT
eukprot:TRINITY_DN23377_c0_g1_i1.p1 TRINITY_DN23377_c0_g1~~TRINITY_DN23377_c0_g1_i1.p1  ORF type:complete len:209 (-),score=57.68 TRINITY_DN23377_c0_g1_i1:72-698(-)